MADVQITEKGESMKFNVPKGSQFIQYYLGQQKQRIMTFKKVNVLEAKFKPQMLDYYPEQRPDFKIPNIAPFCFPSGIQLSLSPSMPKSFSFILTDIDGNRTYTSVLFFDEAAPDFLKEMVPRLKTKTGQAKPAVDLDKL